jgi:hypothetical protein
LENWKIEKLEDWKIGRLNGNNKKEKVVLDDWID